MLCQFPHVHPPLSLLGVSHRVTMIWCLSSCQWTRGLDRLGHVNREDNLSASLTPKKHLELWTFMFLVCRRNQLFFFFRIFLFIYLLIFMLRSALMLCKTLSVPLDSINKKSFINEVSQILLVFLKNVL